MLENILNKNMTLLVASILFAVGLVEGALHLFIKPSEVSYGTVFGRELPPYKLIPDHVKASDFNIGGQDDVLGYVVKNNQTSKDGWVQTNNVAARYRSDVSPEIPVGKKRILAFGDSYTFGYALPQDETWPYLLEEKLDRLQILNFGVSGYSIGQSYLRFQRVTEQVDYNAVILVFVPKADLWRDINVSRYIGMGWEAYMLMPRFIIEDGKLRLVERPYKTLSEVIKHSEENSDHVLREFLRKYDRFYFPGKFEVTSYLNHSILFKLMLAAYYERKAKMLRESLYDPLSEAMQISKMIFREMHQKVRGSGKEFVLVVLGQRGTMRKYRRSPEFQEKWDRMVKAVCDSDYLCIDTMPELVQASPEDLDRAYDGSHFGPEGNQAIAEILWNRIGTIASEGN